VFLFVYILYKEELADYSDYYYSTLTQLGQRSRYYTKYDNIIGPGEEQQRTQREAICSQAGVIK
jgi:hypothetical protein